MYRIGQAEVDEVTKVLMSGKLFRVGDPRDGHLREVDRFEEEWAQLIGTEYALLMCGGGTAALVCALAGLGIGPGDEVIVPAYTWMATATAVLTVGAIPVLAEIDATMALDPEDFAAKISPATRAVIPVHMVGRPADMERIIAVARNNNLKVIEDSCQMVGGSYKGKRTGSWGDAGAFSFNWYKIISAGGEGGALVTNSREIYERAVVYHDSGAAFRPRSGELRTPIFVAQQYRADEVMGAIARIQAQRLDGILADLRRVRKTLEDAVTDIDGVSLAPNNDADGDCGVVLTLQFDSEVDARAFKANSEIGGYVGIDHGKHVYTEWEPLRQNRIMHHPEMNPFSFPRNQGLRMDYSDSACPRTLDRLRKTLFIPLDPDWSDREVKVKIEALRKGAQ